MEEHVNKPDQPIPPNNLSADDVMKTGVDVGKDVVKQAVVWTAAAFLTQAMRNGLSKIFKK